MPEVLDWQRIPDPHAAVHYSVQALRGGRTVAFPTETGYALTASGLLPGAVQQLLHSAQGREERPAVVVRGVAEARDWAPRLSPLAQRLTRRLWPGPVELVVGDVEAGLVSRLPAEVRPHLCPNGTLRLCTAGHEAMREVLRHLGAPLLLLPLRLDGTVQGSEAGTGSSASVSRVAGNAQQAVQSGGEWVDVVLDDGPSPYPQGPTVIAVNGDTWQVLQPGVISAEQIQEQTSRLVLFVCTGNTCRSPLAEALCKKQLADRLGCTVEELPARGVRVYSAGLSAMRGGGAALEAVEVARQFGADLSYHRSQPLSPELAAQADYLVVMTSGHLHALLDHYPHLGCQPRLLNPSGDIADPIGQDQPVYEECGQQIWRHLEALVPEIIGG
jgi:protein-tyrosine-phosphatase/tRNA A37 threonylcarbamoyladenosine synthetase subunit TsaC/SUA5/YrdC